MTTGELDRPRHGNHGCYLRIDVTSQASESERIDQQALRRFLGGSGLGTYLLLREGAAEVDPLAPEAVLAFVFSPLVGSPLTTSAKFAVVSKSPLTGRLNDSLASSRFALEGKKTGHDAILLRGKAAQPSVLLVDDDQVRVEPAEDLWGLSCPDVERLLKKRYGPDYQAAVIGPAGEQQVRYATISHDGRHAGRGGSGAVLGSKNIKAVLVRGSRRVTWSQPEELVELAKELSKKSFGPATAKYRELGTAANMLLLNRLKALPTRNFQQGSFEQAVELSPEQLSVTRTKTRTSCAACTIGCEHIYGPIDDDSKDSTGTRVEYENLFALGSLCGVGESDDVLRASRRCDELGLDTISAGGTIAFAMECVERGYWDVPWLQFGDGKALLQAIEWIGKRHDVGDMLAEGSRCLAEKIGHDSIQFAPQVKGLEIPGYEPRALQTMGLGFAVAARGADHNRSSAYEVDIAEGAQRHNLPPTAAAQAVETENRAAIMDSLILCKFLRGVFGDLYGEAAEMLQQVTGWDVDGKELEETAQRIVTAKKWFNIRAGWKPAEDTLPARFLNESLADDQQAQISKTDFQQAVRAYNQCRGWSDDGWIQTDQLEQLGIDHQPPTG
ncbi:MAG: aldehyde ferredoxin oxidoreductase family protein [Pirellulaceae bacterium]